MISNEHVQVLQTLLNNGYINPEATDTDVQGLLDAGHTLAQLKDVTEEQARIAQQVIDTGEPFSARTAEGPINIQPDEADDYLNEALRLWLGVVYRTNVGTDFTRITSSPVLRMIEQYNAELANLTEDDYNDEEGAEDDDLEDVDLEDIVDAILNDNDGYYDEDDYYDRGIALEDTEEAPILDAAVYRQLLDDGPDMLDDLIDWYLMDSTPGTLSRISNLEYEDAINIFGGLGEYQHNNYRQNHPEDPELINFEINITPETLTYYLNHMVTLEAPDDEDAEEAPVLDVALYRELLNEDYDTLDILVDWYLADSSIDTLSRIANIGYADVISVFEGLEEYQHNNYRQNYPEDPDLREFHAHITADTLTEYLNHMVTLEEEELDLIEDAVLTELLIQEKDIKNPRTINSIIMKGW